MRKLGPPSEIRRLAAPVARVLDGAWQRMHWWIATMGLLYVLSGITVVKPDEVAVILRWGRLAGETPALQQHGPGILFAFPQPVDEVVRVQVKRVSEVTVSTLMAGYNGASSSAAGGEEDDDEPAPFSYSSLSPLQGYAITGDHNIVHVSMVARYRIREPGEWAFHGAAQESILRVEVTAAMVRSLGEMGVDRVLSDGRKDLIATATRRAQAGLDASRSGLELTSLELTALTPPRALASQFDAVQSAFISAETRKKEAQAFAEGALPQAKGTADAGVQSANADASSGLAQANGAAGAFLALDHEYRANPVVVRERLYRDSLEHAFAAAGAVRWIPPPVGGNYHGFRITVGRPTASGSLGMEDDHP
jgi:modulator of FtsH protease HflK